MFALSGCEEEPTETPEAVPSPAALPTTTLLAAPSIEAVPTTASVTLTVWAPIEFSPFGEVVGAELLLEQITEFEATYPEVQVNYEPKPVDGPASLLNYLRSSSAVAPAVLPDLIIIPATALEEAAQTGLLFPLDSLMNSGLQDDFYPFATRDTRVAGEWVALPLAVQAEHGVTRMGRRSDVPETLEALGEEGAPTWLFAGQATSEGEMSNAMLLQLLALDDALPGAAVLPEREAMLALFQALQEAAESGAIPRQVLSLDESAPLIARLQQGQANLVETTSRQYLRERESEPPVTFAPLPTLTGVQITVVDGFLLALTTENERQQQAAVRYVEWLLDPVRLAGWSEATAWLPARRTVLPTAVDDELYAAFLDARLEQGWLRPTSTIWRSLAQAMQEQFRAVILDQTTPAEAVESLEQVYTP